MKINNEVRYRNPFYKKSEKLSLATRFMVIIRFAQFMCSKNLQERFILVFLFYNCNRTLTNV